MSDNLQFRRKMRPGLEDPFRVVAVSGTLFSINMQPLQGCSSYAKQTYSFIMTENDPRGSNICRKAYLLQISRPRRGRILTPDIDSFSNSGHANPGPQHMGKGHSYGNHTLGFHGCTVSCLRCVNREAWSAITYMPHPIKINFPITAYLFNFRIQYSVRLKTLKLFIT